MSFDKTIKRTQKDGERNTSLTPATVKLNRLLGKSITPRMLTPYEIELLQQSKKEMAQAVDEILLIRNKTNNTF